MLIENDCWNKSIYERKVVEYLIHKFSSVMLYIEVSTEEEWLEESRNILTAWINFS